MTRRRDARFYRIKEVIGNRRFDLGEKWSARHGVGSRLFRIQRGLSFSGSLLCLAGRNPALFQAARSLNMQVVLFNSSFDEIIELYRDIIARFQSAYLR